jgi:Zn-dependent protease with chaperone function
VAKEQGQPTSIRPPTQTSAISTAAAAKVARNQDGFWDQPLLKKNWDVAYLKTDDEYRLGLELQELILQFNPRLATGPWQRRVEEAAEPLLNTVNRKDVRYTFTVLDSDQPNAFSHPGGFIYVTRGLLEMIGEDEDDALQFAVGHEMAHVDLKHAIKTLQDPGVAKLTSGTLQKLYMLIIPLAYLDAQEFEADEWIYRRMKQLHQSDRECLRFLNKLESYSKREGFDNGRGVLKLDADSSPVENHLRAHTAPYKRLKHLKEIMGKNSNPSK